MQTQFLKFFLDNVGSTIHSINSACVGLEEIRKNNFSNPEKTLHISWHPKDLNKTSKTSREYIVKSAYIFLTEAVNQYQNHISKIILKEFQLESYNKKDLKDKLELIYENCYINDNILERYRLILLKLLVISRNKIVHFNSKASLSNNEIQILKESKELIIKNHSGLDIIKTLSNIEKNRYTLKDISSIAANCIFMTRQLDKYYLNFINNKIDNEKYIPIILKEKNLEQCYNNIEIINNKELKERKKKYFFKIHLPELSLIK